MMEKYKSYFLNKFETVTESNKKELIKSLTLYQKKEIPDSIEINDDLGLYDLEIRRDIIKVAGFPLLAKDWISPLSQWIGDRKVLEIMAGCGSLTYTLKKNGIDIIATDDFSWKSHTWETWANVEKIDCIEAIKKYNDREIVLCSWAYTDDTLYKALLELRKTDRLLIYVGENQNGCTASDEFFKNYITVEDKDFEKAVSQYKSYNCIHDCILLVK